MVDNTAEQLLTRLGECEALVKGWQIDDTIVEPHRSRMTQAMTVLRAYLPSCKQCVGVITKAQSQN